MRLPCIRAAARFFLLRPQRIKMRCGELVRQSVFAAETEKLRRKSVFFSATLFFVSFFFDFAKEKKKKG